LPQEADKLVYFLFFPLDLPILLCYNI